MPTKKCNIIILSLVIAFGLIACSKPKPQRLTSPQQLILNHLENSGAQVIKKDDETKIILPSDDLFIAQSAKIKPSHFAWLNQTAALIAKHRTITPVTIAAYTDNVGNETQQLKLTQQQATNIAAYLWSKGLILEYTKAVGFGAQNPIASNMTPIGSAQNRRVEIIF